MTLPSGAVKSKDSTTRWMVLSLVFRTRPSISIMSSPRCAVTSTIPMSPVLAFWYAPTVQRENTTAAHQTRTIVFSLGYALAKIQCQAGFQRRLGLYCKITFPIQACKETSHDQARIDFKFRGAFGCGGCRAIERQRKDRIRRE